MSSSLVQTPRARRLVRHSRRELVNVDPEARERRHKKPAAGGWPRAVKDSSRPFQLFWHARDTGKGHDCFLRLRVRPILCCPRQQLPASRRSKVSPQFKPERMPVGLPGGFHHLGGEVIYLLRRLSPWGFPSSAFSAAGAGVSERRPDEEAKKSRRGRGSR